MMIIINDCFYKSGYALDPTVDGSAEEGKTLIGAKEAAVETGAKTVFESTALRDADKRKRKKNDDAADIEGFLGPWGGYVDEKRVMKPSEEESAELEEILAKRNKRGKATEEKPLEEKTVLHSKDFSNDSFCSISFRRFNRFLCVSQSRTAWIIKVVRSCTHPRMLELICDRIRHPNGAFYPKPKSTRGKDTRKEFPKSNGFQKPPIYCYPAVWIVV